MRPGATMAAQAALAIPREPKPRDDGGARAPAATARGAKKSVARPAFAPYRETPDAPE